MKVNGYQCDACCSLRNREDDLKGWFVIYSFKTSGNHSDEQHFCSLHCLHGWVEKQIPVVENVETPFEVDVPRIEIELDEHVIKEYWRDL